MEILSPSVQHPSSQGSESRSWLRFRAIWPVQDPEPRICLTSKVSNGPVGEDRMIGQGPWASRMATVLSRETRAQQPGRRARGESPRQPRVQEGCRRLACHALGSFSQVSLALKRPNSNPRYDGDEGAISRHREPQARFLVVCLGELGRNGRWRTSSNSWTKKLS
ncbi:hypothetical protein LIA77_09355 [Sarocladium implicatum]|nr:hypothetical protein LIA77_09355 [Sarocladium implicatum]